MAQRYLTRDKDHKQRLREKHEKLEGLKALLEEWTEAGYNETDLYVATLHHRIRLTEVQLKNMRP